MIFLHEMDRESSVAFNMSLVLSLQSVLSLDVLYEATRQVMVTHESLRTIFRKNADGSMQQAVLGVEEVMPPVKILDARSLPPSEKDGRLGGGCHPLWWHPFGARHRPPPTSPTVPPPFSSSW